MRVLIAPHGTRGDVQPLLALAIGLRRRGHVASFLVPANFVEWVRSFGFPAESNGIDVEAHLTSPAANLNSMRWQMRHFRTVMVPALFDTFARLTLSVDIIIGAGVQVAAASAAEKWKVPYVNAAFCPCVVPSGAWPPPTVRTQSLPPPLNRFLWTAGAPIVGVALRGMINEGRRRLGLGPIFNPLAHMMRSTTIIAADPDLAPLSDDVPDQVVATDAWVLRERAAIDPRLARFLNADPPPIYAGFGSMVADRVPELAAHVVAAVRAVGRRLILAGGWAELDRHVLPIDDDVLAIGATPHDAILPHVALAIHHGGAGTTAAAARTGVPQLLIPHVLDQFFWAHRVEQLGLGPRAIPVELVNADVLSARIDDAFDPRIGDRAAAFAPVIAGRDGVPDAVDLLERVH